MMKAKRIFGSLMIALLGGFAAIIIYVSFDREQPVVVVQESPRMQYVNLPKESTAAPTDFTLAAEIAVHAVVHVKTKVFRESSGNPFYDFFFGYQDNGEEKPVMGYGSGVILTSDGYIVTNNHVIEGSQEVEVVLNDKRAFDATVVGRDPTTDLAVLKIKTNNLPFLEFGNSDVLRLGEWVLAVGNPYNLTSTVTAGIVSAKARNINILRAELALESFIQTDAAVNPGNSGGALVNTMGELVGINAAIASRTGAFTGYSFAIPVSIVEKVTKDIIEFGAVQRAIIGVTITELNAEEAKKYNIDRIEGVRVSGLRPEGAAISAGIEVGDIIIAINGVKVNSPAELQEQVSRYRPNDKISVTLNRKNRKIQMEVVLRNAQGGTGIVEKEAEISALGASFEEITSGDMDRLGIRNGVKVTDIRGGKFRSAGIREGFIVTEINNEAVKKVDDIMDILETSDGGVYIEGIYPDGLIAYYAIRL
ncbi:trypsin-like peptidase domain-containing protein [Bacteroidota bacterium]